MDCPECKTPFYGSACSCGYKAYSGHAERDRSHRQCSWETEGRRCLMPASISDHSPNVMKDGSTVYPKMFCSWHYQNLAHPGRSLDRSAFATWFPYDLACADEFWALTQGHTWHGPKVRRHSLDLLESSNERMRKGVSLIKESAPLLFERMPEYLKKLIQEEPKLAF